ncbi:MAG: type IV secretory system conjugative DNA transfer family protein [Pseudomonadota bacterium]
MAGQSSNTGAGLLPKLLLTAALGYGLAKTWPNIRFELVGSDIGSTLWVLAAGVFLVGLAASLSGITRSFLKIARLIRALRPPRRDASARWLTRKDALKQGLHKPKGLFLGIVEGVPIFVANGVHGVLVSPARKGKTISLIMAALCFDIGMSRIVTDLKGELAYQTAKLIARLHGHFVIIVNPAHKFGLGNARYNPLVIILDDLRFTPQDAIADCWSLALQLIPPAPGGDRDPFWPNGTRKLLVFVIIALCVLRERFEANLPRAFEILGDNDSFERLLIEASDSEALAGELANLAHSIASTWDENPKHFESFRESAVQALVAFGPSGRLAASMTECDFRFSDLKNRKCTLFLLSDYSRMDVFAPWLGVLIWAALKEMVRSDDSTPVQFLLDEFTNYRLPGLPNALTALGGYGVRVWMVVQELEEVARAYGREALATILSQTDVKQFFGVSHDASRLVSQMLGDEDITSESFGLGAAPGEMPNLNIGRTRQPLLTPDQIRRLPDDEQILFIKNLPPIRALKVGYHEVDPWRDQVEPNPLHGGVPYLGKVKLRLRGGRAIVTRVGIRKIAGHRRPLLRPLFAAIIASVSLTPLLVTGALSAAVLTLGWPHLLWEYTETGTYCRYLGLPLIAEGFETFGSGRCPLITFRK